MPTYLYTHPDCLKHNPGPEKSFAPARLTAIVNALQSPTFKNLVRRTADPATPDVLKLIHTPDYIANVLAPIPDGKEVAFDFETFATSGTADAALASAGLALQAVKDSLSTENANAFCLVSPGGHHAEADMAEGYCFFNTVALAAVAAQKHFDQKRVAVFDFDAHHGNGTQSFFWNYDDRLYISLHKDSPLTGFANETGAWQNIMNIPLPTHCSSAVFRNAIQRQALPKLTAFRPDLLFISAGFDMHRNDPLGGMALDTSDYEWLGHLLRKTAETLCHGRLVVVLEGGYDLNALGASCAAFIKGMMEENT